MRFTFYTSLCRRESEKKLNFLRSRLKPQGHKVGIQDPMVSVIEGIASRGDERAGDIFEEAYRAGCRLDSWSEYLKRDVWEALLEKSAPLVVENNIQDKVNSDVTLDPNGNASTAPCDPAPAPTAMPATYRILFSFTKRGSVVFQSHLCLLEIFAFAFVRAGIPVLYSQGFNPLPRLDIASPLSLGISAGGEIAAIDTEGYFDAETFMQSLNACLPEGLAVTRAMNVLIPFGHKKHSVSSLLWGYSYASGGEKPDLVKAREEKSYRAQRSGGTGAGSVYGLERLAVLACPPATDAKLDTAAEGVEAGVSYFDVYRELYPLGNFGA